METTNPILENPLLIAAILLFLSILPLALRQKKKTTLDKAVERFEKEELKAAAEGKPDEDKNRQKKPIALRDGSLAYPKKNQPTSQKTKELTGIPPFPTEEDEKVKIVKPGVPISHFETEDPPVRKKVKLIKQEFSIAPDPNKVSPKKDSSAPQNDKKSGSLTDDQKSNSIENSPVPPHISDNEESKDSWIEAEIPGLTLESPVEEKTEDIPVFNAFPKEEYQSEAKKSHSEEKQGLDVKNLASKTEEEKDLEPEKQVLFETDSTELEMEISESESKEVEIKGSVPSHKSIAKKETEPADAPLPKAGETEKTEPEMAKLKPFLLDLRYLDQEESEAHNSVSQEKLSPEMADATISRLNALQVDLESQFDKSMRKDRIQDPIPSLEGNNNGLSDKKEVSLEKLDSFLFTATQRNNKE